MGSSAPRVCEAGELKIIDRYIGISLLAGCVPVLLLLLSLFSLLAFSKELEDVGEGIYQISDALLVVALGLPVLVVDLLPVTVLLGGLLGLGALANNNELTILRAAAVSPGRLALPVVGFACSLIVLAVVLQSLVIPQLAYYSTQLRSKTLMTASVIDADEERSEVRDTEFWTRTSDRFVRIGRALPGRQLSGIEIYRFDEQGHLVQMLQAPSAELLRDNTWQLQQVQETRLQNGHSATVTSEVLVWNGLLSEEQTHALVTPANQLAPTSLWRLIQRLDDNAMNSARHRVLFWKQVGVSLGLLGMALLTLPFLLGSVRSVPVGQRITLGGVIGISYYLSQQISGHLAGILQWNIAATVLAPAAMVLALALGFLWRVGRRQ